MPFARAARRWRAWVLAAGALLFPSPALAHNPGAAVLSIWICLAGAAAAGIVIKWLVAPPTPHVPWARLAGLATAETFVGVVLTFVLFRFGWLALFGAALAAVLLMAKLHAAVLRTEVRSLAAGLAMTIIVPIGATILLFLFANRLYF